MEKPAATAPQRPIAQAPTAQPVVKQAPAQKESQSIVKKLEPEKKTMPVKTILIALAIVLAGVGSGYGLSKVTSGSIGLKSSKEIAEAGVKVGDVVGSSETTFKDDAQGVLQLGGVVGEGSHHLLREGGPDQTVYLTSSVVDLSLFVDHKIQVWGETFSAQKAGWLMDVGKVKVLELNAPKPFEEE